MVETLCGDLPELVQELRNLIEEELKNENIEDLETIKNELSYHRDIVLDLYKKKIRNEITKEEYQQQYSTECNLIKELEDKEKKTVENNTMIRLKIDRLDEMKNMIDKHDIINKEAMRRLLDHIVVLDKHRVEFQFKCGVNETEKI